MAMGQAEYIHNVFRFGELKVSDVMVHRTEMVTVNADDPAEEIVSEVLKAAYTRIPIWRESPENIIGILHAKDLLRDRAGHRAATLRRSTSAAIARPPWFVPDIRPVSEQLKAFRRRKTHFALVVDEYGEVMGLVTLEDILEEIVGDISDEHDVTVSGCKPQPDGSVVVDGAVPIRDLNRMMDWDLPRRRGDHHRRAGDPRGAHDPGSRPELHVPRLPLPRAEEGAQPHHRAARRAAEPEGAGREGGVRVIRLGEGEVASAKGFLPLAAPHPRRCTETASWLHKKSCRRAGALTSNPFIIPKRASRSFSKMRTARAS